VRFRAFPVDTIGLKTETDVRWKLFWNHWTGSLDEAGLIITVNHGIGLIKAFKER
jgi:hypothetical protein